MYTFTIVLYAFTKATINVFVITCVHTLSNCLCSGHLQVYVDQVTEEIVAVTRHSPSTHQSVILMAHTAFSSPWTVPTTSHPHTNYSHVPPLTVPGQVSEIVLEARLLKRDDAGSEGAGFCRSEGVINGLVDHVVDMRRNISLGESQMCRLAGEEGGSTQEVVFTDFCPGSIIIFRLAYIHPSFSSSVCIFFSSTQSNMHLIMQTSIMSVSLSL